MVPGILGFLRNNTERTYGKAETRVQEHSLCIH